ncbi:MAG: beta-lactamase family protein [Acidobacteriales bacterium]|nr:beta-lactamase family protein [Terriglobales bacterium]
MNPPVTSAPTPRRSAEQFPKLLRLLHDAIRDHAFPGASVAVTRGQDLELLAHVGRHTYEPDSAEVDVASIYDLASLTKVMATVPMAMVLHQRGRLDLKQPLVELLPEFALISDALRTQVTLGMLLAHTSGLPGYVPLFERCRTPDEVFALACHTHLQDIPGHRTEYSDIGFILLGRALERIAGEAMDSFCAREIFQPLSLSDICFNPPNECENRIVPTAKSTKSRSRLIKGEVHDDNAYALGGVAGHAGLFSTALDVARFADCMLRGGAPILKPETVTLFTSQKTSGGTRTLGWDTPSAPSQSGHYFSPRAFGHLGYTGTSLWCDPEKRLSVTLLTNRTWPDDSSQAIRQVRPALHDAIIEALGLA